MKILVISDTHGKSDVALLAALADTADLVIHLGDGYSDGEMVSILTKTPVVQVTGNVDYPLEVIPEKMIHLEGRSTLLTHGHLYGAKAGYGRLVQKAKECGASLVLFGHTHRADLVQIEDVILFNPGSASFAANPQPSVGLLLLEGEQLEAQWVDLKKS